MGGRGSSSGAGGMSEGRALRQVERMKFEDEGFGTYSYDVDGVGGGQIQQEYEPNGGTYFRVKTWDADYNEVDFNQTVARTLSQAKRLAKDNLKKVVEEGTEYRFR